MNRQMPVWMIVVLSNATMLGVLLILGLAVTTWAENSELDSGPRVIAYNGVLEFNGQAFTGPADVRFRLTDDAQCNFTEDHEDVQVFAGRFSVNIGSVAGDLPTCLFNADAVFLEMSVRGGNEETDHVPLAGRQRINPAPFSYWAAEGSDFRVDGTLRTDNAVIPIINGNTTVNGDTTLNGTTTVDEQLNVAGDAGQIRFTTNEFDRDANVGEFSDFKLLLYPANDAANSYGFGIQGGTLFANSDGEFDFKISGADEFNLTATDATFNTNLSATGALSASSLTISGDVDINGKHATIGVDNTRPDSGLARLRLHNNVADTLDNLNDYQLLLWTGGTATESYGLGIQGSTLFYNVALGAVHRFYAGGNQRMTIANGGVNVPSALAADTFTSRGNTNIAGEAINTANSDGLIITCNWNGGSTYVGRTICGECSGPQDDLSVICRNGVVTAINVLQP